MMTDRQFRTTTGPWGTVVSCRGCGRIVLDEDRPTERDVEDAISEHVCVDPRNWERS